VTWRAVPAVAGGVLVSLVIAVAVICRGAGRRDSAGTDRLLRWWAGGCLRAAGARVVVHGLDRLQGPGPGPGPCVVVANHQSGLDPVTQLKALPLSLRILAMQELFQLAVLGRAMRNAGMIAVDRESPSLRTIIKGVSESLAAGHSLLIFPEGKLSVDGSVGEFKDGAFLMAVMNKVPVLPVAISGTRRIWPATGRPLRSGTVHVTIGPLLPTSGLARRDVPALREQAREFIAGAVARAGGAGGARAGGAVARADGDS
jgi:1-acyl-sn-glycerol-3-phosphate acyltransferase